MSYRAFKEAMHEFIMEEVNILPEKALFDLYFNRQRRPSLFKLRTNTSRAVLNSGSA